MSIYFSIHNLIFFLEQNRQGSGSFWPSESGPESSWQYSGSFWKVNQDLNPPGSILAPSVKILEASFHQQLSAKSRHSGQVNLDLNPPGSILAPSAKSQDQDRLDLMNQDLNPPGNIPALFPKSQDQDHLDQMNQDLGNTLALIKSLDQAHLDLMNLDLGNTLDLIKSLVLEAFSHQLIFNVIELLKQK